MGYIYLHTSLPFCDQLLLPFSPFYIMFGVYLTSSHAHGEKDLDDYDGHNDWLSELGQKSYI